MSERPYSGLWFSCDGLYDAEIRAVPPDGHYPPMVRFEFSYGQQTIGGMLTVEDAEDLVAHLGAAASWAEFEGKRAAAASSSVPSGRETAR